MLTYLLAAACLVLTGLDAYVTRKMIKIHGPEVELNPAARWLAEKFGPNAAAAEVVGVSTGIVCLLTYAKLPIGLGLYLATRVALAVYQFKNKQVF